MKRRAGIALLAWAAYLALANLAWLRAQLWAHPPNWDRALYLYLSVRYLNAYRDGGFGALAAEFVHRSTTVAPFFPLSTLVSYLAFGESRLVAHATTCLYMLVLLAATYALGRRLYDPTTGLLAAFVLSSSAGITLASRDYMLDLPAAALATAAVALLVDADFGRRLRSALAFGILLGLTVLTKTMAGVFLIGPLAEALWRVRRDPQRASLALGLLAALVIASTWWGPNHAAALAYLWSYGFSDAAQPFAAGGESLLTLRNISYYPMALVNEGVGPIVAAQLIAAGLLLLQLRLRGRALPFGDAFLLRWLGISLAILTAVPNKSGARYSLGLLPPLALILAGAVAKFPSRGGRRLAALAVTLAGLHSHAALTYDIAVPRLYYHVSTGLVAARPVAAPHSGGAGDVENAWPVRELLDLATAEADRERVELGRRASSSPASLLRASDLSPARIVREAYLRLLKRPPDPAGLAAYVRELERGSLTPEGLVRAIADSNEFRSRPARVLVVTNHPFLNASVMRYYAERARLPLAFEHPERSLPPLAVADLYDLAVLKRGGDQGPGHTTLLARPLEHQIRREGSSWRPLPNRLTCPDGAVVEVFASGPA